MSMLYIWQAQPLQLLANTAGKLAIVSLLVKIHGPRYARAKLMFVWTLAAAQMALVLLSIGMIYTQCTPARKLWQTKLPGRCSGRMRNEFWAYVQGGVSSLIDLALAIYPIFLFWDLRIKLLRKIVLSVLFAFGILYFTPFSCMFLHHPSPFSALKFTSFPTATNPLTPTPGP
ncbi:MAG: hypothetical protein Q9222_004657 [Ikaeria aurantiellina]